MQIPDQPGRAIPEPTIDTDELSIEVDSVASFGEALLIEAEDVGTNGATIKEQLSGTASDDRGRSLNQYAFGSDPRQTTLNLVARHHVEKMDQMNLFIENVQNGLTSLGNITAAICAEYGDQDALNAADVTRIQAIIDNAHSTQEGGRS